MPTTHVVSAIADSSAYIVTTNGTDRLAYVLSRRAGEVYVHYENSDKRLDEWIPEETLKPYDGHPATEGHQKRKRDQESRSSSPSTERDNSAGPSSSMLFNRDMSTGTPAEEIAMTEEEYDIQHHKQITAQRNFDKVNFGSWQIKTWYFSPYPLTETEADELSAPQSSSISAPKIPGVHRTTIRSHGRTSDLLAGGLHRAHANGEKSILWVCDRCFKYMPDGLSWELHMKNCNKKHPPGRKVYQRGAHTIWEVDGAKDKLFCQNLSLFGKLFIDVKTLFFDCDNFLFYILTDADSQRDHVLGFFSKEKVSYDDYNLACIITLPPYQRRGYGMLLIEFSYELSRRAGKVGTPERPLSDLGLRSYLAYWISTLVRFLRRLLSVVPPEQDKLVCIGSAPTIPSEPASPAKDNEDTIAARRKKRMKGWDGETTDSNYGVSHPSSTDDPMFTSMRTIVMRPNKDGSASAQVYVKCTLADIARATNLRVEDAAFALNECGLLSKITRDGESQEVTVLTREMVEQVAVERNVKKTMMDLSRVLL